MRHACKPSRIAGIPGVEKTTYVSPVIRDGSRSPQWCGAWWRGQSTISKSFINSTDMVAAATSPSRSIEIPCNQVNFLRNHNGAKSQDEIFGDSFLLGVDVADMQGQDSKKTFDHWLRLDEMRHVKEHLARPIPVLLQRLDLALHVSCHESRWI